MNTKSPARLAGAALIISASAAAAWAQTPPAPSTGPAEKPAVTQPEAPPAAPAQPGRSAVANSGPHPMIGRNALSSDGNRVGDVRAVKTAPDGRVTSIQLKVGGFLGFGGRMVEVTEDKFTQKGDTLQIDYTLEEVDKLPDAEDNS